MLLKDPRRLERLDNVTWVSILARVQAMLLLSCLRIINRITPQGGGGGGGGGVGAAAAAEGPPRS